MKLTFEITKQDLYDQDILLEVGELLPRTKYENEEDLIEWVKHNFDELIFFNGFRYLCKENVLLIDNLSIDEFIKVNKKELIDYFKNEFDVFFTEDKTDKKEIINAECCFNCSQFGNADLKMGYCFLRKEKVKPTQYCEKGEFKK